MALRPYPFRSLPLFCRPSASLSINESMEDYGLFVWPFSIVLVEYVWQQRLPFSRVRVSVVELGAETSLPGLGAAKVGSDVTQTDDANRLEVLANMRSVSDLNNLNCNVMGLTWGVWNADIFPCALSYRIQYLKVSTYYI